MKRLVVTVLVGVLAVCVLCLGAAKSLTNHSGKAATGVVLTFSDSVRITSYEQAVFLDQNPTGRAERFTFSGGELTNGGLFTLSWTPSTAEITNVEWETTSPSTAGSSSVSSAPLTYQQIMAQITHFPDPDESQYVPAEGEQIWLTDLEGHADIHDTDSIKINYAPGFDKSQITRIDVYRNGVRLRFVPALFDVLTNEQMKTFDGNPADHSPASSHTDHAILGYQYDIRLSRTNAPEGTTLSRTIVSPFRFSGEKMLNIGIVADTVQQPFDWLVDRFRAYRAMGFDGIQFSIYYITNSATSNLVYGLDQVNPQVHPWARTLTESELREVLRAAVAAGLTSEVRIEVWVSLKTSASDHYRGALRPTNPQTWFDNYAAICVGVGKILEEEGCDVFTPMVELSSMEPYDADIRELLARIGQVYTGRLCISSQTQTYLALGSSYDSETDFVTVADRAAFWDYPGLEIGLNCWPSGSWESQSDQRLSVLVERLLPFWERAFAYYRAKYPGKPIRFTEMGSWNFDGVSRGYSYFMALGYDPGWSSPDAAPGALDNQEDADLRAAMMIVAKFLDAASVGIYKVYPQTPFAPGEQLISDIAINGLPAVPMYSAVMGGESSRSGLDPNVAPYDIDEGVGAFVDWNAMPQALSWGFSPSIRYVLDGQEKPLSTASYWNLPGSEVASLRAALFQNAIAFRVDLQPGDSLGHYRYIIGLGPDNGRFYIFVDTTRTAYLAYCTPEGCVSGDVLAGELVGACESSVWVIVPFSSVPAATLQAGLSSLSVDLHIDYVTTDRRELFLFPGKTRLTSYDISLPIVP